MLKWLTSAATFRSRPTVGRSYWQRRAATPENGDVSTFIDQAAWRAKVDYVVVGGGFAGLMTSIRLAEAEPAAEIVVLEAQFAGFGASGRNAGLVSPLPAPMWLVTAESNAEHAWALTELNKSTHRLSQWLSNHAPTSEVRPATLRIEASGRITAAGLGRVARALEFCRIEHRLLYNPSARSPLVIEVPTQTLNPFGTVQGLTAYARQLGVDVREGAPVSLINDGNSGVDVTLGDGRTVHARAVVVATNAYTDSVRMPGRVRAKVMHNYMVATLELSNEVLAQLPAGEPFVVELNRAYVYYRLHKRRLIYGGIDKFAQSGDDFTVPAAVLAQLERLMDRTVPGTRLEAAYAWGGKYHLTRTELPQIERTGSSGSIIMNVGYGGTGVALTMICAKLAASLARTGQIEDLDDRRLLAAIDQTRLPVKAGLRLVGGVAADLLLPKKGER